MPRYFFDLHSDCLSTWDDEGTEFDGSEGLVRHALGLLRDLPNAELGQQPAPTVTARDAAGHVVLTATLKSRSGARAYYEPNAVVGLRNYPDDDPDEMVSKVCRAFSGTGRPPRF